MFNLKPNKMEQTEKIERIEDYKQLHIELYRKMMQNNDMSSCDKLSKMFDMFLIYGSYEFTRGLEKGKEIWK